MAPNDQSRRHGRRITRLTPIDARRWAGISLGWPSSHGRLAFGIGGFRVKMVRFVYISCYHLYHLRRFVITFIILIVFPLSSLLGSKGDKQKYIGFYHLEGDLGERRWSSRRRLSAEGLWAKANRLRLQGPRREGAWGTESGRAEGEGAGVVQQVVG